MGYAVEQACSVRISTTGWIHCLFNFCGRYCELPTGVIDYAAFTPAGNNQRLKFGGDILEITLCALLYQFTFVVIYGQIGGLANKSIEFIAVEHGQTLPRIKDKRNVRLNELLCMLDHGLPPIRRQDAQGHTFGIRDLV